MEMLSDIVLQINDLEISMDDPKDHVTINTPQGTVSVWIEDGQTIVHKDSNKDTHGIFSAEISGDPDRECVVDA